MRNVSAARTSALLRARHLRGWQYLTAALAVHVADEALTDFLQFYNPLVLSIRQRISWFPMPTFRFDAWLIGLVVLVVALVLLSSWIRGGSHGAFGASWIFSAMMLLNGVGHLAGSAYFERWLPGATSAPLLLVASVMLMRRTFERQTHTR